MRIWSVHPKYLDAKGLIALWRETLLAKNVLEGNTKGYTNHPQLNRFKEAENSLGAIHFYLKEVWQEARARNYNFDKTKFKDISDIERINVTLGQLRYEQEHLLRKLKDRDPKKYKELKDFSIFDTHSLFNIIEGEIESWEKL